MSALVVVKFPNENRTINVEFAQDLQTGESLVSASLLPSSPLGLTATIGSISGSLVPVTLGPGTDGQSYGVVVEGTTNTARVISKLVAVVCNSQIAYDYQNVNPDAFNDLIGELEAGQAAVGNASFLFPPGFDATGGAVTWDLIDRNGVVYSNGTSFDYQATPVASGVRVTAQAVVNVPSDALPTLQGQSYQLRWTLNLNGQTYFSFETLVVTSLNTVPQGVEDVIELVNSDIPVQVVFSRPYENVSFELFFENDRVVNTVPVPASRATKTPDGYLYTGVITGIPLEEKLEAYTIVWTGYNTNRPADRERLTGRVFITNASILSAAADLRLLINKSFTTIAHQEDMLFTEPLLLSYLRSGRDYFNGAGTGMLTAFTMLNAQGSIREFWIRCSAIAALRAQYLGEGEKAFNFSGQAISLDVDRTQYYQGLIDMLKSELDQELKPFKQNLIKKGIIGGDGNLDPNLGLRQRIGAAGAVGITLSPATGWSKWGARWGTSGRR